MRRRAAAVSALLVVLPASFLLNAVGRGSPLDACRALADLRIEDTNLLSAVVVPGSDDLPEYCRVLGYVRPAINFEIRLPTSGWNGKFYMAGCGFCGNLNADSDFITDIKRPLQRHYAVSMTDAGFWSEGISRRWAFHNRQAEIDFGYRAVHETTRVTKSIIEALYEQPPAWSYFGGCSNAGRLDAAGLSVSDAGGPHGRGRWERSVELHVRRAVDWVAHSIVAIQIPASVTRRE